MFNLTVLKKHLRKILFTIVVVFVGILIITFFSPKRPTEQTIPSLEREAQKISNRDVKDLRWLNNQELAYTFFSEAIKQRALAKTDGLKETVLFQDVQVKMSEIYWSKNNNLLIFDYGDPYKTYLFSESAGLKDLGFNGYAFSWSPDGNSFFFLDIDENGQESAKTYETKTDFSTTVNFEVVPFQVSAWSPSGRVILLYNYNLEIGRGELSLLVLVDNSTKQVSTRNVISPSWAPIEDKLAYAAEGGLYVYSESEGEQLIYKTNSNPQFISYNWLNNNELLIFDAEKSPIEFVRLSLQEMVPRPVFSSLQFQPEQRIKFAISPNQKIIAVASEKDGLWFVKNTSNFIPAPSPAL